MTASLTTSTGVRFRTSTQRRYVVVDRRDAEIRYRTDDRSRAIRRATTMDPRAKRILPLDVIDTETGEIVR